MVAPTIDSDDEVRSTLGDMHRRMIEVAEGLDVDEAGTVLDFLERMRDAVDSVSEHRVEEIAPEAGSEATVSSIGAARSAS